MNILATLVYVQNENKTLMILPGNHKHDLYKGKWNGLGGKFEEEESPEECAKREVFEESGLKITELKLCGVITFPKVDEDNDWYVFVYKSNKFTGKLKESKEGILKWHNNDEIFELILWEGDYIFLPWIIKSKFFSAKFMYDKGKLKNHEVTFYS